MNQIWKAQSIEWAIGNGNDKRASSGCGENYVTETGPTYTFSP